MVLDTSAVIAILEKEPGFNIYWNAMKSEGSRMISTMSVLEAAMVVEARRGEKGAADLDGFLREVGVRSVPFDSAQLTLAREAWRRYGKGRHPASLNFSDCAGYALSKISGEPLLFKGNDFALTDVARCELDG